MSAAKAFSGGVVLAGGVGRRMWPLTRVLYGWNLPKQFATFAGDRSMLQTTVERLLELVPEERIVVVITREHQPLAEEQLRRYPGVRLVGQPCGRGTAAGVLLGLGELSRLDADPQAPVVITPADHHVARPDLLTESLRRMAQVSLTHPELVTLLGLAATCPATDLGWILPVTGSAGAVVGGKECPRVARFVEKPALEEAQRLLKQGALWNSLVVTGTLQALWELFRRQVPQQVALFDAYFRGVPPFEGGSQTARLERLYERLDNVDFSADILERADTLAVYGAPPMGWSDWGTPERLMESLAGTPDLERLLRRCGETTVVGKSRRAAEKTL